MFHIDSKEIFICYFKATHRQTQLEKNALMRRVRNKSSTAFLPERCFLKYFAWNNSTGHIHLNVFVMICNDRWYRENHSGPPCCKNFEIWSICEYPLKNISCSYLKYRQTFDILPAITSIVLPLSYQTIYEAVHQFYKREEFSSKALKLLFFSLGSDAKQKPLFPLTRFSDI